MIYLDIGLVQTAWIFLSILAGLWIYCLYLANQPSPPSLYGAPYPMIIGGATFIVGVVLTEIKEFRG